MKDSVYKYILDWRYFYAKIPYGVSHFERVLKRGGVIYKVMKAVEVRGILEVLCQERKLVRVRGEYMLHPEVAHNGVFVEAFMNSIKKNRGIIIS
ncbi:MAG: hypothetical protein IT212_07720 [Bacteroidia bacterium]|nr:hypothetical protein [Bacteroidia bacterium]